MVDVIHVKENEVALFVAQKTIERDDLDGLGYMVTHVNVLLAYFDPYPLLCLSFTSKTFFGGYIRTTGRSVRRSVYLCKLTVGIIVDSYYCNFKEKPQETDKDVPFYRYLDKSYYHENDIRRTRFVLKKKKKKENKSDQKYRVDFFSRLKCIKLLTPSTHATYSFLFI